MTFKELVIAGSVRRLASSFMVGIVVLAVSGCDRGPKIVPVTGKVTLDGKPMPFKSVYFFPERSSSTAGDGAVAMEPVGLRMPTASTT